MGNYFTKKSCKNANWFEEGKSTALQGNRIDSNKRYNKCKTKGFYVGHADIDTGFKAGVAIYCDPKEAYKRGRNAKPNRSVKDFCEPNAVKKILTEYKRGVNDFCQKSAAYTFAVEGNKYPTGFCPDILEKGFLAGYNKGRITFLKSAVIKNEARLPSIETSIRRLEREKSDYIREMAYLPRNKTVANKTVYNPETGQYEVSSIATDDSATTRRYNELDEKVKDIEDDIDDLVEERGTLSSSNARYKQEIMTLENQIL